MTTNRITQKDLEMAVRRFNLTMGENPSPTERDPETGKFSWNIGTYMLDQAYGGSRLVRVMSNGGGITVISSGGYISKKELYHQIHGMMNVQWNKETPF